MKTFLQLALALFALLSPWRGLGQGFVNLSFEHARFFVTPTAPGQYGGNIDPALAFNGWTVTDASGPGHYGVFSLHNTVTIGSSAVDLIGPQFPNALNLAPLQGFYSVLLQGTGNTNFFGSPGLIQNGVVPDTALSISFLTSNPQGGRLTVDGLDVPLFVIPGNRIAGDISAFAGRNVQLMVSTAPFSSFYFDDVRFSPTPVPEPSTWALLGLGTLFFAHALRRRKNR